MEHTFTQDFLIRFLYRETTAAENEAFQHALDTDFELRDRFNRLKETVEALDCSPASPKATTVDRLLRYSQSTAPLETMR